MKKLWSHLKRIWNMPHTHKQEYDSLYSYVSDMNSRLGEHTTVHADIRYKGRSQIIVIGEYRNHDYVHVFDVDVSTLTSLIEMLQRMEKNSKVGRFDMPSTMPNLSAVYQKDRF